jgi:cyclohexa-1,5-dienecarbonyl-CoA hydratase
MSVSTRLTHSGSCLRVTFAHSKGNILTLEIVEQLRQVVTDAATRSSLKLLVLEGAGRDFSFGASIEEHQPDRIGRMLPATHALLRDLLTVPAVTLALVRGRCLGGGFELALACDLILASTDAVFGLPEIALGVFPPAASILLPMKAGQTRAAGAVLTGEPSSAVDWHNAGVVNYLAPAGDLDAALERWIDRHLTPRSAVALHHATEAVRMKLRDDVDRLLPDIERLYLERLMATRDAVEGVAAFLEKRSPRWEER